MLTNNSMLSRMSVTLARLVLRCWLSMSWPSMLTPEASSSACKQGFNLFLYVAAGIQEMLERVAAEKGMVWEDFFQKLKKNNQWHVEVY